MKRIDLSQEYFYVHDETNAHTANKNYFQSRDGKTCYYFSSNRGLGIKIRSK